MRLIDADSLIEVLENYAMYNAPFPGEKSDVYHAISKCIKRVEEQPTVFDVDKVLKTIDEEAKLHYESYKRLKKDGAYKMAGMKYSSYLGYCASREIVRRNQGYQHSIRKAFGVEE